MKEELKQKWVDELRSGKYEQGRRCLKSTQGKYCCLGVLCEISDVGEFDPNDTMQIHTELTYTPVAEGMAFKYEGESGVGVPPLRFLDHIGFVSLEVYELAKMNDAGVSFDKIADYIEEKC